MDVLVDSESVPALVSKRSSTASEAARLRREAAVLGRAAHPGVVQLTRIETVPEGTTVLWTRHVRGSDLATLTDLTLTELAGLGAAVATILADLHDLGIVHGAVGPDHIIVGDDGRPVLCSLGYGGARDDLDHGDDVAALRRLLAKRLPPGAPRRFVRLLTAPAGRRRREPTARAFATSIIHLVGDAHLPSASRSPAPGPADPGNPPVEEQGVEAEPAEGLVPTDPAPAVTSPSVSGARRAPDGMHCHPLRVAAGRPQRLTRRRATGVVVLAGAVAALAGVGMVIGGAAHRSGTSRAAPCPAADRGCGAIPVTDGRFSTPAGTFAIDLPAVEVVLGRWTCARTSLPAALDRRSGRIWVWHRWAQSTAVSARPVASVRPAEALVVAPQASGCDRLVVRTTKGATVVVDPLRVHR